MHGRGLFALLSDWLVASLPAFELCNKKSHVYEVCVCGGGGGGGTQGKEWGRGSIKAQWVWAVSTYAWTVIGSRV